MDNLHKKENFDEGKRHTRSVISHLQDKMPIRTWRKFTESNKTSLFSLPPNNNMRM